MLPTKQEIITQLQKDILPLQGFKPPPAGLAVDVGLGPIAAAFPNGSFPTGAVHEFLSEAVEQAAAATGFVSGILATLMQSDRVGVWISSSRTLFPPALKAFGIDPDRIIFIDCKKEKDVLWAMEESLKCEGLAVVVGEIPDISFTVSRRLQLAVEQSRVTGFLLRHQPRSKNVVASVSRWTINPLPSELADDLPGVGFPRWNAQLLKIRNGRPGTWRVEWSAGTFNDIPEAKATLPEVYTRKTG